MYASEIPGTINVLSSYEIDGVSVVHTICVDYDHYTRLPAAVEFGGKVHARTGWNSDRQEAYYKNFGESTLRLVARAVRD